MFTINWNNLGINKITNLFLYGQLEPPTDLQDEALIRQPEVGPRVPALTQITLTDVASFMTNGPGRYDNATY